MTFNSSFFTVNYEYFCVKLWLPIVTTKLDKLSNPQNGQQMFHFSFDEPKTMAFSNRCDFCHLKVLLIWCFCVVFFSLLSGTALYIVYKMISG